MAALNLPALLAHTPADERELAVLRSFLPALRGGLLILQDDGGLSPFYLAGLLAGELERDQVACGLALHTRDKNARALAGDLATAGAMNFHAFYLAEPDWSAAHAVNTMSTHDLLVLARARLGPEAALLVPARLEESVDRSLLASWQEAGADTAVLTVDEPVLAPPAGLRVLGRRETCHPGDVQAGDWLSILPR